MTFVKFCGMMREADVETAAAFGVDAVGFVLWPGSPRAIPVARVKELARRLPPSVLPVGVFVRPSEDEVARAGDAGVRAAQLHGLASVPNWSVGVTLWIAASFTDDALSTPVPDEHLLVLDALDPVRHGGTGRTIDWARAAAIAARRQVLLAGGLNHANVADAIRIVQPFGVDVASGIESRPGVKDPAMMREFVERVRQVIPS